MVKKATDSPVLPGVEFDLDMYSLLEMFNHWYRYHNEAATVDSYIITGLSDQPNDKKPIKYSRFDALRRLEAVRLGARPWQEVFKQQQAKPNFSSGHQSQYMKYLSLPYRAVLADRDLVRTPINRRLYDKTKLSQDEQIQMDELRRENEIYYSNDELSQNVASAFKDAVRSSNYISRSLAKVPRKVAQDSLGIILHDPDNWFKVEQIDAIDLVTEPLATVHPDEWNAFFVIKKMSALQVRDKIKHPGTKWKPDSLRWALEESFNKNGSLSKDHITGNSNFLGGTGDKTQACDENYMVKSFIAEKEARASAVDSYYGNLLVVEAYYINTDDKVDKKIFFPSNAILDKLKALTKSGIAKLTKEQLKEHGLEDADCLYFYKNAYQSLDRAITLFPVDEQEAILERLRGPAHEIIPLTEAINRIECNILFASDMMANIFYKTNDGQSSQKAEELLVHSDGVGVDMGGREIVPNPYPMDLNALISARSLFLSQLQSITFIGGLDNLAENSEGRGQGKLELQLMKDGKIHKYSVEPFADSLETFYSKLLAGVLEVVGKLVNKPDVITTVTNNKDLAAKNFARSLALVYGHDPKILLFEDSDVYEGKYLPYWMDLAVVRNGVSFFGPAEMLLYREINQLLGPTFDQDQQERFSRMVSRSMLGAEQALDILGDPRDKSASEQEHIYQAMLENNSIIGSVDMGAATYGQLPVVDGKQHAVPHITTHNEAIGKIMQQLEAGDHATEAEQQAVDEHTLETKVMLILRASALSTHTQAHLPALDRFGNSRDDINQLREETNYLLQQTEGLFNGLQDHMQALQTMRNERMAVLQGMAPENDAEREKIETEKQSIMSKERIAVGQQQLLAKIADDKKVQHIGDRVDKAKDRQLKEREIALKYRSDLTKNVISNKKVVSDHKTQTLKAQKTNGTNGRVDN